MQPTKKRRKSPLMITIPEELDDLLADLLPPVGSLRLQSVRLVSFEQDKKTELGDHSKNSRVNCNQEGEGGELERLERGGQQKKG